MTSTFLSMGNPLACLSFTLYEACSPYSIDEKLKCRELKLLTQDAELMSSTMGFFLKLARLCVLPGAAKLPLPSSTSDRFSVALKSFCNFAMPHSQASVSSG